MPVTYGAKYNRDLSTKQIAALVRAEIRRAVKAKMFPVGTYSVRIEESNTSASINVRISDLAVMMFDPQYLGLGHEKHFAQQRAAGISISRWTPEVRTVLRKIEEMLAAYNFEDPGSTSNVNFFASVEAEASAADEHRERLARAAKGIGGAPRPAVPELDEDREVLIREAALFNVVAFRAPVKPSEDPEQVRFLREAGVL